MSSLLEAGRESPLQLRLFRPPEGTADRGGASGLSPNMTVSEFFHAFVLPLYLKAKSRDAKTVAEYTTAVGRWAELTGDPSLCQVDQATCAAFVVADLAVMSTKVKTKKLSPNTVRKHCTHLQMVLDLAGPLTRERPEAATDEWLFGLTPRGLPRKAPWFSKPDERDKPPEDCFTLEELGAWIAACKTATQPRLPECSAACWWRALIDFLYNSELRIGSALFVRRSWISRVNADEGMVEVPGDFYKGGRPHQFYLSPHAMAAIESIPTTDLIFPWTHTMAHLGRVRKKLLTAAGIPAERQFGFHGIRKASVSEVAMLDLDAARGQAGHASAATTTGSYVRPSARGRVLASKHGPTMRKIPQPRRSESPLQRRLFD